MIFFHRVPSLFLANLNSLDEVKPRISKPLPTANQLLGSNWAWPGYFNSDKSCETLRDLPRRSRFSRMDSTEPDAASLEQVLCCSFEEEDLEEMFLSL